MKNLDRTIAALVTLIFLAGTGATAQGGTETPAYSNVQVVSIDTPRRVMVVRKSNGRNESLIFDDLLESTGAIKAGDHVLLTVLGGPGRRRVSAVSLIRPSSPQAAAKATPPARVTMIGGRPDAAEPFARQVAAISEDARAVDSLWASFVTACEVRQHKTMSNGRDWFGLWDGRVDADYTDGNCRKLFNQIVASGETIKKAMAAAEGTVDGVLEPGEIRRIRGLNNMNWDGWTLPPPAKRDP